VSTVREQDGYNPLETCPKSQFSRYEARGRRAVEGGGRSTQACIELKCLECCAWDYRVAQDCEIRGCPLWTLNRRYLRSRGG